MDNGTVMLHMGFMLDKVGPLDEAIQLVSITFHKKDRNLDMADPPLLCKGGTGVLVSRLRVTEKTLQIHRITH